MASNNYFVFPIAIVNGVVSPVRMFVIIDTNGYVSVWVDHIRNAMRATNFNADGYNEEYTNGVIYNRMYCKNLIFINGSEGSWMVPTGTKLCLNGHSITYMSYLRGYDTYAPVINATNSVFDLYECDETVHYYYVDANENGAGRGVVVDTEEEAIAHNNEKYGSFKGGYITGGTGKKHSRDNVNSYNAGGAIYGNGVDTYVTMHGGTLIGNSGGNYGNEGAAVHVSLGTFKMTGGNMLGNYGIAVNVEGPSGTSTTECYLEGGLIRHNSGGVRAYGQNSYDHYGDADLYVSGPMEIYDNYRYWQDYETKEWRKDEFTE